MSSESANDSNRRIVEEVLRRDLPAGKLVKTEEVVRLCGVRGVPKSAAYSAVLAIARRCPAASQDKDHGFVRFGRQCYPYLWRTLGAAEPLMVEELPKAKGEEITATYTDEFADVVARRVVSLLMEAGNLQLATLGAETTEPEECILCRTPGTGYKEGLCPTCWGPENEEHEHV